MRNKKQSAEEFRAISETIRAIKHYHSSLTRQQFSTLCGQAKAGNPEAALRGLHRLLTEKGVVNG